MNPVRFLLDEHVQHWLANAVWLLDETIDIRYVGGDDAPPKGTKDPELLRWAETNGFTVVTKDKTTMPDHADVYISQGGKTWGLKEVCRQIAPRPAKSYKISTSYSTSNEIFLEQR